MIEIAIKGILNSGKFCMGSAGSFLVAAAMPEESLLKEAGSITGWILALICIYTLARAVRVLYKDLGTKEAIIRELLETAEKKAEEQRKDMLKELQEINRHARGDAAE